MESISGSKHYKKEVKPSAALVGIRSSLPDNLPNRVDDNIGRFVRNSVSATRHHDLLSARRQAYEFWLNLVDPRPLICSRFTIDFRISARRPRASGSQHDQRLVTHSL